MDHTSGQTATAAATHGTIVQFGAGAIGRGFLGQLWTEGGYEVIFVDVAEPIVAELERRGAYPLRLLQGDAPPAPNNGGARSTQGVSFSFSPSPAAWEPGTRLRVAQGGEGTLGEGGMNLTTDIRVGPVRALLASDISAVADALARCRFACTAVGVGVFTHLAPVLAEGITRRSQTEAGPLNILCCENQARAGSLLQSAVTKALQDASPAVREYFAVSVAFVDASVGRMVPPPTPELLAEDPLLIAAEPYKKLPIDGDAWLGPVPDIPGLLPKGNFAGYVAHKLFTHNGGHALLAYEGALQGHEYIWQAAEDPALVADLWGFWGETGAALVRAYGFDPIEQRASEEDLLSRFRNRALGDTVARVGRDPARKLRRDDRLVGAGLFCLAQGIAPRYIARAAAAALRFDASGDPSAVRVQEVVQAGGVKGALTEFAGLAADHPFVALVETACLESSG